MNLSLIILLISSPILATYGNIIGVHDPKLVENKIKLLTVASELNLIIPPTEFFENICNSLSNIEEHQPFHIISLQNNTYKTKELQIESAENCAASIKGILSLLKWKDYQNIVQQELQSSKIMFLSKSKFNSYDLISAEQLEKTTNEMYTSYVIVEILPIGYQLKNIQYLKENNIIDLPKPEKSGIFIGQNKEDYSFEMPGFWIPHMEETVNSTFSILNGIHGLDVEIFDDTINTPKFKFEEISLIPITEISSNMRLVDSIVIPPKTALNATIWVSYSKTIHNIQGIIITTYGKLIDNQLPMIERSQHFNAEIDVKKVNKVWQTIEQKKLQNLSERSVDVALSEANIDEEPSTSAEHDGTVYPGFRTWFYLACALLFGVLFIALYDIVRTVMRERRMKRRG